MLPQVVEMTMNSLCRSLNQKTSIIESVYIYGSTALGDYIEGSSDIDFIAVLREQAGAADIQAISAAHDEVEKGIPNTDIMGAYLLIHDLGKPETEISSLLTYYDNQLHVDGKGGDINPITWWILKKHGIRISGSHLSFDYDLDVKSLLRYVIGNLNTYWVTWIDRLEEQLSLLNLSDEESMTKQLDQAVEWCTLGMLRQLYTLKEHDITSKTEAGLYGIATLPQKWHGLIHEAIHIKRRRPDRCYTSNVQRLTDLLALLRYIHLEANRVN